MLEVNRILNEDCLETMAKMPNYFVDLTVTSPPYDNLRAYNGYSFDIKNTAKELYRITKLGGVVVWVVSDQTKNYSESCTSFKCVFTFIKAGWLLYDTMIWRKKNSMPGIQRRYADEFEFMFVFSKGNVKTFNPIKIKCITAGRSQRWSNRPHESKVWKHNTEYRKTLDDKIKGNIWEYATGIGGGTNDLIAFNHPAIFPEQLAFDHIFSWSNKGDIIYDPFMGSGTTAKAALQLNRNYIGSEISKEYCVIAEKRINIYKSQYKMSYTRNK